MDQLSLISEPRQSVSPAAGDCGKCGVPLVAVEGGGGQPIGWQCPTCLTASAVRMPPAPRGAKDCPVCLRSFTSVRRHWSSGAGRDCKKFYDQGMIWSRDRPEWASHAEQKRA